MEICYAEGHKPSEDSLYQIERVLKRLIRMHLLKNEPEICEMFSLTDIGSILITNCGDLSTYSVAIHSPYDMFLDIDDIEDPLIMIRNGVLFLNLPFQEALAA
jgi:hypothetical protein